MKTGLVRFGVAFEAQLLSEVDVIARERGCTRSELFRDLARGAVGRAKLPKGVEAVAALTIVYDHHVRDLTERLTQVQHDLGNLVRSTMHVHLSHDYCLEVLVMQGRSDELQAIADRILATRGVKHGGIEIVSGVLESSDHARPHDHRAAPPAPASKRGAQLSHRSRNSTDQRIRTRTGLPKR
jgi:CopG family nickel-responsive transcriptional regulator